ncbi:UDP-N-acetylmuramate--L-alanine ligase [Acaryochloris sp. IP29b_bin.137]|uniref:UDP-N-acetylmuramate--L-alanine ligase n=1 Tax=Acaryochloris sp. IP29b_bin.137 TaxID=2969217 RepID=UPI00261E1076|nr:UDP-N-acetylmuramate--L-alanine ligase [Acaryochloris sp. IP29b_bin.137]
MQSAVDLSGRPIHFIGIGGIGMSALAHILLKRQLPVSGSDLKTSHITQQLDAEGAQIFWQQEAANIQQLCQSDAMSSLPQVICSTAIHEDNPEYQAAVQRGCPIFHRSDVLAALIQEFPQSIAIAGTHGKTTTSSLVGYLLLETGLDPTIIVGGEVAAWGGNARTGDSAYLVAEADESDGSLVKFSPHIGVITNIELDHPDHYSSIEQVVGIFQQFVDHCHTMIVSADCPIIAAQILAQVSDQTDQTLITYGLDPDRSADYTVRMIDYSGQGTAAEVLEHGEYLGQLQLPLLGEHNLSNALAAVAIGRLAGLKFSDIANALSTFAGAKRRFEIYGEAQGICFVDDYAHHPSEIQMTLGSARLHAETAAAQYSQSRVVAVFQPHRYSRVTTFLSEFSQSFQAADMVVVTDIYSAGEPNPGTIDGQQVADAIAAHHPHVTYQPSLENVVTCLQTHLQAGDVVLFLGAGNLNQIIPTVLAHYQISAQASPEVVLQ